MGPVLNYYIENQKPISEPQSDSELPSLVTLEVYEKMLLDLSDKYSWNNCKISN